MFELKKKIVFSLLAEKGTKGLRLKDLEEAAGLQETVIREMLGEMSSVEIEGECVRLRSVSGFLVETWVKGYNVIEVALKAGWRDFEGFVSEVLARFGYVTLRNLAFRVGRKRFQVDVVGALRPVVLVVDCKRWSRARTYHLKQAALAQAARAQALCECPPARLRSIVRGWDKAAIIPVVVSLLPGSVRIFEGVPLVPIALFPSFLSELDTHREELLHYTFTAKGV